MKQFFRASGAGFVACLLSCLALCGPSAACDCHARGAILMSVPTFSGIVIAQPLLASSAVAEPTISMAFSESPGWDEGWADAALPPGTLGATYQRTSHPIPADKHPRTAMLAVRDGGAASMLSVQRMGGFRMKSSGVWLFESERPLDHGVCQIVRVEARHSPQEIEPYATKFVRLIPGRIVYLDF